MLSNTQPELERKKKPKKTLLMKKHVLNNMSIVIICFPICDVVNFEINLSFLIKPFSYMTKTFFSSFLKVF